MRRVFNAEEIEFVAWCYEFYPTAELAEMLDATPSQLQRLANRLGVHKSREVIAEVARQKMLNPNHGGRAHQFKKGQIPQNKGKKMPPGWAPGRMRETQFKKGQRSGVAAENHQPVGTKRVWDGYLYRKVADVPGVISYDNWKLEHVMRWEKKHGPVPAGHAVVFRDGDRRNIKLSNLELVTRAELMRRNTVHNLPKDLVQVIMLNGALKRKIRRRLGDAEEQDERPARPPVRNSRRAA